MGLAPSGNGENPGKSAVAGYGKGLHSLRPFSGFTCFSVLSWIPSIPSPHQCVPGRNG